MLKLKNNSDPSLINEEEALVAGSKRQYELVRFDLVNLLNQLEIKKKFQLVERVCSGLYANLGFFHQCHTLVAIREPSMRDLQEQLTDARKEFARTERLWNAKKTQLEVELSQGFFPRPRFPSSDIYFGGDEGGDVGTPKKEISFGAGGASSLGSPNPNPNSRPSASSRLSEVDASLGIVKNGFLWKKSASNIKRDWKRRWFMIQGGKLKYLRQEDPSDRGQSVTVCDVMLCTVRERLQPTDSRFVFEIVSPQNRTYVCKAENETEYNEWISAIREQTEVRTRGGRGAKWARSEATSKRFC